MRAVRPLSIAAVILGFGIFFSASHPAFSQASLPQSTAVPVLFTHTIDAAKVKPGDAVTARTLQVIQLAGGLTVRKGATLEGHVVEARAYQFDATPYAHQKASYLALQFDRIEIAGHPVPAHFAVRALSDYFSTGEALKPQSHDDIDHVGTMVLIGGGEFSPLESAIKNNDGDVIAYNRRHGVFARLIGSEYTAPGTILRCNSTDTEQSVAIFAPDACGLYGFPSLYMTKNGAADGAFRLESPGHTVRLYAGSAALLQVVSGQADAAGAQPAE